MSSISFSTNSANSPLVLILGDSLSAGYGINPQDGWVSLMQERMKKKGLTHRILNESISGDTTDNGLSRMPEIIAREKFSFLVLALGANDGLRGLPLQPMKDNLKQIITLAQEQNAKVLLVGIVLPANYGPFYRKQFAQVYVDLAQENNIVLLDNLLKGVPIEEDYFQDDRLHPAEAAQPIIMENVWTQLNKIL